MFRWIVMILCTLALPSYVHAQGKKKPPNIIYIMSDDHANAAIGAYNSWLKGVVKTPNLDKLAKQGMLFRNSVVTNSICTPSRAAMLTGQHSHKNGVYTLNDSLDPSRTHIAHLLRMLGYQTALFGKWHLTIDPTGMDSWAVLPGQGVYNNPKLHMMGSKKKDLKEFTGGYSEDVITDLSLEWLKKRDKDKPFMLFCQYKAPHRPWDPAPRYKDLYKDVKIPEPETLLDDYKGRAKQVSLIRMRIGQNFNQRDLEMPIPKNMERDELRKWGYQHYLKRYLSCVKAVDDNVGRIMAFLEENGLAEDTIIIYTSDQGFFLGEHGFYDKRLMYEPAITTPLIIRWPGHTQAGTVNKDIILNIDHAPTFLDVAGGPISKEMQGKSYKSILQGKTPDWRQSSYYRYWMHMDGSHNVPAHYGVRTDRYTLIHYYGKALGMKGAKDVTLDAEWELFDRQKDPLQMSNVFADQAYQAEVRSLQMELNRLRKEVGDDK